MASQAPAPAPAPAGTALVDRAQYDAKIEEITARIDATQAKIAQVTVQIEALQAGAAKHNVCDVQAVATWQGKWWRPRIPCLRVVVPG